MGSSDRPYVRVRRAAHAGSGSSTRCASGSSRDAAFRKAATRVVRRRHGRRPELADLESADLLALGLVDRAVDCSRPSRSVDAERHLRVVRRRAQGDGGARHRPRRCRGAASPSSTSSPHALQDQHFDLDDARMSRVRTQRRGVRRSTRSWRVTRPASSTTTCGRSPRRSRTPTGQRTKPVDTRRRAGGGRRRDATRSCSTCSRPSTTTSRLSPSTSRSRRTGRSAIDRLVRARRPGPRRSIIDPGCARRRTTGRGAGDAAAVRRRRGSPRRSRRLGRLLLVPRARAGASPGTTRSHAADGWGGDRYRSYRPHGRRGRADCVRLRSPATPTLDTDELEDRDSTAWAAAMPAGVGARVDVPRRHASCCRRARPRPARRRRVTTRCRTPYDRLGAHRPDGAVSSTRTVRPREARCVVRRGRRRRRSPTPMLYVDRHLSNAEDSTSSAGGRPARHSRRA